MILMLPSEMPARHEDSVRKLYEDRAVAESYIRQRFATAWSRLLHETQVRVLNDLIAAHRFRNALELAPGPARLAPDLRGIRFGVMVEASEAMLSAARTRLRSRGLENTWEVRPGNAFDLTGLDRTFDFAFTFRLIRHFTLPDRARLYEQIRNRLNPGGYLVFDAVNTVVRSRLDARAPPPRDALPVYDVTYTAAELGAEMRAHGFEVVMLRDAVRRFDIQSWLSYKLGPRFPSLAWHAVRILENVPSSQPLEWVAVCRKTDTPR